MTSPLESAIVRIRKTNGVVVGAGFSVSEKHVITCAHVVADALGISRETQTRPTEDVFLDFPLVASEEKLTARVVFWRPVPPKGSTSVKGKEDIAALEINSPIPRTAQPVDLLIEEDLRGHSFRTFGFPAGHDDGLEATGVLRGQQGTGWVQIEDVKETGVRLEPGFSGAPVWDEQLNGIVGMAVAADQKRPEAKVAFMIPTKVIATAWTALGERTIPPLHLTQKKRFRFWRTHPWTWFGLVLVSFLCGTVLLTPPVREMVGIGKPICFSQALKQKKLVIGVADFDNIGEVPTNGLFTEERLLERLEKQKLPNVEVCPISKKVSQSRDAHELGKNLKAAVIIWGRVDSSTLEVFLKVENLEVRHLTSLSENLVDALKPESQTQYWPERVAVMTAYVLSEIYKAKGKIPEARKILETALENAKLNRLNENNERNAKVLSIAYLFLGMLIEKTIDPNCQATWKDCQKAIQAYKRASDLNEKQYEALVNLGFLHERLQEPQEALKAYTRIINSEPESPSAVEARKYRADIYLNQGKAAAAAQELQIVCQLEPEDPMNYHFLGLAQLEAGQIAAAEQTYRKVKLSLDKDNQAEVFDQLRTLAKKRPDLANVIKTIMTIMQAALVNGDYRVS
ncbi:trypsin-like peptidase domain-containing protein [Pelatocladus sp. BLCC-F211]|uniref:trypsin-like peptidase domain-containing protein n=1 Tax=Pelatocladus sp. BLCC-F211 TaxID=3342752 RepID=UPI0035B6ADA4